MSDNTVFIALGVSATRDPRIYHTDRECLSLQQARKPHPTTRSALPDDAEECTRCREDNYAPPGGSKDHYNSLIAAAEDDV